MKTREITILSPTDCELVCCATRGQGASKNWLARQSVLALDLYALASNPAGHQHANPPSTVL
jgi:hypothetical protein